MAEEATDDPRVMVMVDVQLADATGSFADGTDATLLIKEYLVVIQGEPVEALEVGLDVVLSLLVSGAWLDTPLFIPELFAG